MELIEGPTLREHLLTHATPIEHARITAFFASPRADRRGEAVRWMVERMSQYGSIDYAQEIAHGLAGAALHEFSNLFDRLPDSRDKDFVAELVPWVLARTS